MFLAPDNLPCLDHLFSGQPTRDVRQLCRHYDLTPQTLRRWRQAGTAPRMALLALFFETPWGANAENLHAINGWQYARGQVQGLERENANLRRRIARLEAIGGFASANAPLMRA